MNKSMLMGRLVRDPEIRYTESEKGELAIANFRIAVDRKFVRKDGVKADYFSCSAFGWLAEFAEKYLLQGMKVVVTGRMENDNYKNEDGDKVYGMRLMAEDIEFAESKKAMQDRMEEEDDRRERSSGRSAERGNSRRSGSSGSSYRERDSERGRSSSGSRRSAKDEDYEDEREQDRDSDRRSSGRSSGSRNSGSRSSSSSRSAGRGRSVDEDYMEGPDEEVDFD